MMRLAFLCGKPLLVYSLFEREGFPRDVHRFLFGEDSVRVQEKRKVGGVQPAGGALDLHGARDAFGDHERFERDALERCLRLVDIQTASEQDAHNRSLPQNATSVWSCATSS